MKKTLWQVSVLCIVFPVLSMSAVGNDQDLLDVLLENNSINQGQYDSLIEKHKSKATFTIDQKGLRVTSGDGAFSMKIGGRVHAEGSFHDHDLPSSSKPNDGTELRRARFNVVGRVYEDWVWFTDVDFADNNIAVKDFFVAYEGFESSKFSVGHQKQPYSLDIEMSSNDIPFIERSIDYYLLLPFVDRAIGVRGEWTCDNMFFAAGIYGDSVPSESGQNEGFGAAARLIYAPIIEDDQVLHLGARGAARWFASNDEIRIRDETTHLSNLNVVDTMVIQNADRVFLSGPEFAYADGPFSVYGEYNWALVERDPGSDLRFNGGYVAATYSLTGESRAEAYRISSGEFKRINPKENYNRNGDGAGAWEVATRLARLDLNNGSVRGGEEYVLTNALNWYLNPALRFMLEWSHIIDADSNSLAGGDAEGTNIFQARVGFRF